MANTLLGFDTEVVVAELEKWEAIHPTIPEFAGFSTALDVKEGITTFNVPVGDYAQSGTGSKDLTSGPDFLDASSTALAVSLTLDQGALFKFNKIEANNYGPETLVKAFLGPAIHRLELKCNDLTVKNAVSASIIAPAALTNTGSMVTSVYFGTDATFSGSGVTKIAAALSSNNVKPEFIMVNYAKYWALIDDLSNKGNAAGAEAIRTGSPNNPWGIRIIPSNLIPSLTLSGSSTLVGLAGQANGAALAVTAPNVQHANGTSIPYTTKSGLNVLLEQYYDESRRADVIGATALIGGSKGVAGSVYRLASQALP